MKTKLLLSLFLLCLSPIMANAQAEFTADGFTYRVLEGNTVALTRVPTETEGSVVVPSTVVNDGKSYTVTQLNSGEDMGAFCDCKKVTDITIPASVITIIGYLAYGASECYGLTFLDGNNPLTYTNSDTGWMTFDDLYLGRDLVRVEDAAFFDNVKNLIVGPMVTTIPAKMFNDNKKLVSIDLSNATSLTTIGAYAFQDCQNLPSVEMPSSLKYIGEEAFENCFALASVTLNEGLEELGNGAFYDTDALTEITIPGSVKKIGRAPFYCNNNQLMKSMIIADSDTPLEFLNEDPNYHWGKEYISDDVALDYFYLGRNVMALNTEHSLVWDAKVVEIGNKVTCINEKMFYNFPSIEQFVGMENVESVGKEAFANKNYHSAVMSPQNFGAKLKYLGEDAFFKSGLTSIILPGTLKTIPLEAFEKCTYLESVSIEEGVEEIGNGAFYDCGALESITLPASLKTLGRAVFYCNPDNGITSSLKELIICDSEESLQYNNLSTSDYIWGKDILASQTTLDYFYLGRDVTMQTEADLVSYAKLIEVGPKVTNIAGLFTETSEISDVKVHHIQPASISDEVFAASTYNATLWVPGGTVADYQTADGWKQFANMQTWSYVINFSAKGHGSITIDDEIAKDGETKLIRKPNGNETVKSAYIVTLTPERGYELTSLTQEDQTEATAAEEIFVGNTSFANPFTVETAINHDQTYVATFAPITYTLGYNLAGGVLPEGKSNPATYTIEDNAITLVNPIRTGYDFLGWTGTDLTEPTQKVTIPSGSIGNRTYTAMWKPIVYSITYELAGGAVNKENPTTYTIETPDFTLTNPTKTGYTFTGWTGTGITGDTPMLQVTIATGSMGERKYTATWKANTYKVSFDANGGEGEMADQLFAYDEAAKLLTANAFKRTGYDFTGWNTKADGSGTAYNDKQEVKNLTATANTTITLFAQWKIITFAVTIAPTENGTVTASTLTPDYGTKLVLTIEPAKGHLLKQLTVNGIDVTGQVAEDYTYIIETVTANVSVAAVFEKAEPADVNNDGTVDVADIATVISVMAAGTNDANADVNKDGTVDVADIATIITEMAARARQQEIE